MKKLFSMFSSRPHHNIADCRTPIQQNQYESKQDVSQLPIIDLQNQTYSYLDADRGTIQDLKQLQNLDITPAVAAPVNEQQPPVQKLVNDKIKTVRIRLIESKTNKDLNKSRVQGIQQTYKAEIKAKDIRFKQLAKTIYIYYTPDDLISQISACSYFNGFKPLNFDHIKTSLFPECEDGTDLATNKKKKSSIQSLKYYVTQTDEGEYHGQMNKNKSPEGNSIMYYKNGNTYIGHMKNRFRSGFGTMVYPDGSSYTGNWQLDAMDGEGKETEAKGDIFIGNFSNNSRCGKGTLTYKNGYVLSCNWVNGYQDGPATLNIGKQQIQVQFSRGQIIKVNQTNIGLIQNAQNMEDLMPHLIQIRVNRDKVQVSQQHSIPGCLTARF